MAAKQQGDKAMSGGENGGHTGKISSFCQDGGCVEVDKVDVRFDHGIRVTGTDADTVLIFDRAEWEAFIAGVKNNEFDWDQL